MTYYQLLMMGGHMLSPLRTAIVHRVAELKEAHIYAERAAVDIVEDMGAQALDEDGQPMLLLSRTVRYIREPNWQHFVELHHPGESTHKMTMPAHVPTSNVYWSLHVANKMEGNKSTSFAGHDDTVDVPDERLGEKRMNPANVRAVEDPFEKATANHEPTSKPKIKKHVSSGGKASSSKDITIAEMPFVTLPKKKKDSGNKEENDLAALDDEAKKTLRKKKAKDADGPDATEHKKKRNHHQAALEVSQETGAASSAAQPKASAAPGKVRRRQRD